jgi:hypothetical protein
VDLQPKQEARARAKRRHPVYANVRKVVRAAILRAQTGVNRRVGFLHAGAAPPTPILPKQIGLDAAEMAIEAGDACNPKCAFRPERVAAGVT